MAEVIDPYRCMDDLEFQQRLVRTGVIVQGELNAARWQLKPHSKSQDLNGNPTRLIRMLEQHPGVIFPYDRAAGELIGGSGEEEIQQLKNLIGYVGERIEDLTAIRRVFDLGVGVGIDRCDLSPHVASMLYILNEQPGLFVPVKKVAKRIYGKAGERQIDGLHHFRSKLETEILPGTGLVITAAHIRKGSYLRLEEKDVLDTMKKGKDQVVNPDFAPHLQPDFQAWILKEAKLMKLLKSKQANPIYDIPPQEWVMPDKQFTAKELCLAKTLGHNPDVVHGLQELAIRFIGAPLPENWKAQLNWFGKNFREKLRPEISVFRYINIGWSVGVSELNIENRALRGLYEVWKDYGSALDIGQVARVLYGATEEENLTDAKSAMTALKQTMAKTPFEIGFAHSALYNHRTYPILIPNSAIAA